MSRRAHAMLILVLVAAVTLPPLTAHALWPALSEHEHQSDPLAFHLELLPLLGLTLLSGLSLLGVICGGVRWLRALSRLRQLQRGATHAIRDGIPYVRVEGVQITFFTAGLLRPRIYASTGAERGLNPEAFTAALLHERAHVCHRDPFWLAMLALAEASAGWFPLARRAFAGLRVHTEWNADRAALSGGAARQGLFDAIATTATGTPWVAALSSDGALERLRWLADPELQPTTEPGVSTALTGLLIPPLLAHALVWTGLVCALCARHLW